RGERSQCSPSLVSTGLATGPKSCENRARAPSSRNVSPTWNPAPLGRRSTKPSVSSVCRSRSKVVRLIFRSFAVSLMLSTGLPSATWRMSRTARCTGGARYGPAPGVGFFFDLSGMDVRLVLDDFADDARDLRRLLLADRVSGVGNLEIRVALRSARQCLEGAADICGRRDAVLHADDDRGRH